MSATELQADLEHDEGVRLFVYDDATGLPIRPGSHVIGHPTIGIGRALDVHGITEAESRVLFQDDEDEIIPALADAFPWLQHIDDERGEVIVEMVFNMGIEHLKGFVGMIAAIQAQDWPKAAAEMLDSQWARQVGARAERLSKQMETGVHA